MQAFRYRGFDATGKSLNGEITATSPEEAERRLAYQQISIISLNAHGRSSAKASSDGRKSGGKLPTRTARLSSATSP